VNGYTHPEEEIPLYIFRQVMIEDDEALELARNMAARSWEQQDDPEQLELSRRINERFEATVPMARGSGGKLNYGSAEYGSVGPAAQPKPTDYF
jgi:hypothetical protein